jgi:hypothetical protein
LNHAYGILLVWEGVRQDGSKVKLLKLRNPWGEREWQGKWRGSDRERWSTLSPALRQQLGHSEQNDGTFFMVRVPRDRARPEFRRVCPLSLAPLSRPSV